MTLTQFLASAGIFEAAVLVAAFAGGWLTGTNPVLKLAWDLRDFGLGLAATVPMLILLAICFLAPSRGLQQIREFVRGGIGPYLVECRWFEILLLALLAGVCEEVFFRGFLYLWLCDWNPVFAVMLSNLLFGAAHAITPFYAMLAAFLGLYLTALLASDMTPNLLIPITAHSVYDFIAFYVIIFDFRRNCANESQD
ncbi:MAG: lysostaphin resistance A-like protein [Planctomycetota bacterium]